MDRSWRADGHEHCLEKRRDDRRAHPSSGHLIVLAGFDSTGNIIVNDPATATNADVQRTYLRAQLESVWLRYSGGTVYLIFPEGHAQS